MPSTDPETGRSQIPSSGSDGFMGSSSSPGLPAFVAGDDGSEGFSLALGGFAVRRLPERERLANQRLANASPTQSANSNQMLSFITWAPFRGSKMKRAQLESWALFG